MIKLSDLQGQEDAVEKILCKPMESLPVRSASETEMRAIMFLNYGSDAEVESFINEIDNSRYLPISKIILDREKREFGVNFLDNRSATLISIISKTIGEALMYMYFIRYVVKKFGGYEAVVQFCSRLKRNSDSTVFPGLGTFFSFLCMKVFTFGFFSSDDLGSIWDKQKVTPVNSGGSDNFIDYSECLQSLK